MDYEKPIICANRWYVYVNKIISLTTGGYSMGMSGYDGNKFVWEVVGDHVVDNPKDNDEIGLWGLIIFLSKTRGGGKISIE